jgi:3-hydroxyacyl-[acyl-carrier-protein] dehydratase
MERDYVLERLPHRPPFLFVDGVISVGDSEISAYRNIELADEVFKGHFPDYPVYPGVLIIEGMAQTAGILLLTPGTTPLFAGIEKARFRSQVRPPCRLDYSVKVLQEKLGVVKVSATARVEEKTVASAVLLLARLR